MLDRYATTTVADPWERYEEGVWQNLPRGGFGYPHLPFNAPWRGQMAKAWRAVKKCRAAYFDAERKYLCYESKIVDVREAMAREQWHLEWYNYGKSLRRLPRR